MSEPSRATITIPRPNLSQVLNLLLIVGAIGYLIYKEQGKGAAAPAHAPVVAAAKAWRASLPKAYEAVAARLEAGAVEKDSKSLGQALANELSGPGKVLADSVVADPDIPGALRSAAAVFGGK